MTAARLIALHHTRPGSCPILFNKMYYEGTSDELVNLGYDPCKLCNP
ncbi:hypothetical protein [Butyrivibrio fibrisolvens]|nr:hypothetical protein [Butyrivibrio fibrisolvens]